MSPLCPVCSNEAHIYESLECVLGTFLGTVHTFILRIVSSELWALQLPAWRLGEYPQAMEAKWRKQVCLRAFLTPEFLTAVVSLLGAELVWVTSFFFFFLFPLFSFN